MITKIKTISIIGDGGWGTTLAVHLAQKGYRVYLWGPFSQYTQEIERTRFNSKFLPGIRIPPKVTVTSDLKHVLTVSDLIVFAVPSQYAASVLAEIKKTKVPLRQKIFLSVTKGIDTKTYKRISEMMNKYLGNVPLAVLSGPTIAMEVAKGVPSTAVIASKNLRLAEKLQVIFTSKTFRIYTNTDVVGVELGGSLKNVIAIACGVCDGLGFGTNTKSALLTRGLSEMSRLGKVMGAKAETFAGLTGLGDLATTAFNPKSRNRSVGEMLGKGSTIKQILSSMEMVAEGVETVKAVCRLAKKHRVPMPISTEVYNIIYKNKSPVKAVGDLMKRRVKAE